MVPNYGRITLDPHEVYQSQQRFEQRYIVGWAEHDIIKVGVTGGYGKRWRRFTANGAEMLDLATYVDVCAAEARIRASLALMFPPAFHHPAEARELLGTGGSGYTECFSIPIEAWPMVIHIAQGDRL